MPKIEYAKYIIANSFAIFLCTVAPAIAQESANSDITIIRDEAVKISNIDDWDFGQWATNDVSDPAIRLRDDTCVFSTTGSYSLTISSQNGTNRLRLVSSDGERIRYNITVRYRDGIALARTRVISSGTTISNMTGSQTLNCTSGPTWNLRLIPVINKRQFNLAAPGVYQDVVTLLVTPE